MKIVLIGGSGFVGSHLVPELASRGHQCLVLTRYPPGCRALSVVPGARVKACDVYDDEQLLSALEGADAVYSMAGILNERGDNGKGFHRVHVELPLKIIQACQKQGIDRLVHLSALHAGAGDSYYLKSKGEAEEMIRGQSGLAWTLVQPSVVFGEGDSFFNRFADLLKIAPVMPLACPKARMQPVWVGDLVRAMAEALERPDAVGASWPIVGPQDYSLEELVRFTASTLGLKRMIVGLPNGLSKLQGAVMNFVPGKPFSSDNYRSLQTDNTSVKNSLWHLGIEPRSIESIVPGYLAGSAHQDRLNRSRQRVG